MYGPMGLCLRNLYPPTWRRRRWRQRTCSASVGLLLSSLALVVVALNRPYPNLPPFLGGRNQNAVARPVYFTFLLTSVSHSPFPPPPPHPRGALPAKPRRSDDAGSPPM